MAGNLLIIINDKGSYLMETGRWAAHTLMQSFWHEKDCVNVYSEFDLECLEYYMK